MNKRSLVLGRVLLMLVMAAMLLTGCSNGEKSNSERLVLTVDDSGIYMDEMMYHVLLAKLQGDLYASYLGDSENYWEVTNEEGTTMAEATKNLAMENAIRYELFYKLAEQEGYVLTEEEKRLGLAKTSNILMNYSEEALNGLGLTKEKLIRVQEKITLASRYYEDFLIKLGVDEEAIKASINPEDYKQYDIQYIYARKEEYEELVSLYDSAIKAENLTSLTEGTGLNSGNLSFVAGQNTFGEESNLEEEIRNMTSGEVKGILETTKGFYILKLIDNTSTKKYEAAVREAVENAKQKAFEPAYEGLKKEHRITIQGKVWNRIEISDYSF